MRLWVERSSISVWSCLSMSIICSSCSRCYCCWWRCCFLFNISEFQLLLSSTSKFAVQVEKRCQPHTHTHTNVQPYKHTHTQTNTHTHTQVCNLPASPTRQGSSLNSWKNDAWSYDVSLFGFFFVLVLLLGGWTPNWGKKSTIHWGLLL